MRYLISGYALQLIICYLENRFIYKRDNSYPVGLCSTMMFLPLAGLLLITGCVFILITGERNKDPWDIIYRIKRK